jgi:hypothetical protein
MAEEKEAFISRWSRLKREHGAENPVEKAAPEKPAPVLPPVEALTPESDYSGFMQPNVKEDLRRLALKKLFGDPHFNAADPFEPFSGDWTVGEPITPELLATLNQARTVLFTERDKQEEEKPAQPGEQPAIQTEGEAKQDEPGRQDT